MAEYGWGLSDEMKAKAQQQLNETAETSSHAVRAVQSLVLTRPDINFIRTDAAFIVRFLRARKFDVNGAFELYTRYFQYRRQHRALFKSFHAAEPRLRAALLDGFPCVICPSVTSQCARTVLVLFASNWDQNVYHLTDIYRALLLSLEKLVTDECVQVNGFVVVVDWSGFTMTQAACIQPHMWQLIVEGLQDCFPARFAAIHFIHQPWFIEAAYKVIKPFLKAKTKEKIHMNGNNVAQLHADIPAEILPADLGGQGPPCHLQTWAQTLIGDDHDFCFGEKQIYWPTGGGMKTRSETFPQDAYTSAGSKPMKRTDLDEELFLID